MFNEAMDVLLFLEFANPANALHKNSGESGLTFMGIYEMANPNWREWILIREIYRDSEYDLQKASKRLFADKRLIKEVYAFYKKNYWDKMRLDEVTSQKIATELFIFAVNVGIKTAVKEAQKLIKVKADGIVGVKTLSALNSFSEAQFDSKFDEVEIQYYRNLAIKNPKFKIFLDGWINRARAV